MSSTASMIKVGKRQYDLGQTLGVGGFSEVKLGIDQQTGKRVALKITYTNDITNQREMNNQLRSVQKEIKSMKKLNHPNIVRLLGYDLKCNVDGKNAIVMVQELAPKGELFDYLMHTNKFDQPLAIAIFHQLVAALSVIHGAGIAHRDLKPENLLFDNNYNLKIVDFGFSYNFKKGDNPRTLMRTELGTKGYMAPEILGREKYTEAADIFAAGVILFIMLAGFPPFQDAKSNDWWFDKLSKKKYRLFWMAHERTAKFTNEAKDIIQRMLAATPAERINVEDIKSTAFYNAPHPDKNKLRELLTERKKVVDEKKRLERAEVHTSRDALRDLLIAQVNKLETGQTLELKNLVQSELRDAFGTVKTPEDLTNLFENLAKENRRFEGLKKLNVNEIDLNKVPVLAKTTEVSDILSVLNTSEREAQQILEQMDTGSVLGHIDDYDPALFDQFQDLDDLKLPLFDSLYYKTSTYKIPASLGMILYSFNNYLTKKGWDTMMEVSIDVTTIPTITLQGEIAKTIEIPVECENGEIEIAEATMPVNVVLQASVFSDPNSTNKIVVFSNGNFHTMTEYLMLEHEITTNKDFSLFASILPEDAVVQPEGALFEAETYDEEKHAQDDPVDLIAEEGEN